MDKLVFDYGAALQSGNWLVIIASLVMIVIAIYNNSIGPYVPSQYRPLAASIIGVIASIIGAILSGVPVYYAIGTGIIIGTSAGGHWSLWGKHVACRLGWTKNADSDTPPGWRIKP